MMIFGMTREVDRVRSSSMSCGWERETVVRAEIGDNRIRYNWGGGKISLES